MKVQRLFLRDVRSTKSLDLDFRDPVTGKPMSRIVLAGANGSGKTTMLECIFGLLAAAGKYGAGGVDRYSTLRDAGGEVDLSPDAQLQLVFDIGFPGEPSVTLAALFGTSRPLVSEVPTLEQAMVGGNPRTSSSVVRRVRNGRSLGEKSPLFAHLAESIQRAGERATIGSVLYFPHNRYLASVVPGELSSELRGYQWAYRYQASSEWKGSTESFLVSQNYLDLEDRDKGKPAERFKRIASVVNLILVDKHIAEVERFRVLVETVSGQRHGLDDLSSGEKQLILLLVEITRRIVPGSVILIDEPEISLHPTWQRGLVAALDKIIEQYDAQVILATHSLEIATSVMPHEVISLSDLDDLPRGEWKPEIELSA